MKKNAIIVVLICVFICILTSCSSSEEYFIEGRVVTAVDSGNSCFTIDTKEGKTFWILDDGFLFLVIDVNDENTRDSILVCQAQTFDGEILPPIDAYVRIGLREPSETDQHVLDNYPIVTSVQILD